MATKAHASGRLAGYPRPLGGRYSLDFINTVERRWSGNPEDFLRTAQDVAAWGFHAGVLSENEWLQTARHTSDRSHEVALDEIRAFRETLYAALRPNGSSTRAAALATLVEHLRDTLQYCSLVADAEGSYRWESARDGVSLVIDRVSLDAMELITTPALRDVRQCPGCDDCGWLFVDSSKNKSRRWCSMEGCGSRAKMRRQYSRERALTS